MFWSCAREVVTVMIGDDDETWDVAVTIPKEVFVEVVEEVRAVSGG